MTSLRETTEYIGKFSFIIYYFDTFYLVFIVFILIFIYNF